MLPRPIASIASIPSIAITSALLILTTNPIALAENPPSSEFPLLLAQTNDPRKAEADRLLQQGIQQSNTGQYQEALQSLQQALELYRAIGNIQGESYALGVIGTVFRITGDYPKAIELMEQALKLAEQVGDKQWQAGNLGNLGNAYFSLGQYDRAIDFHQQSLTINQEIGDRAGEANSLGNLGVAYYSLGQYDRAIAFHQQSLAIKEEIGDRKGEANSFGNLGNAYNSLGQYDTAIDFHQQALTINREIGARQGEALNLGNLGIAYKNLGQYDRAIAFHQQALTINREIGARQGEALNLGNLGIAYYSLGQYDRAIAFHQQALTIVQELGARQEEASILGNLGNAYYSLGQYDRAIDFHQQALTINREIGARQGEALNLGNLGIAYYSLGQYDRAIDFHQQSLAIKREIGARQGEANAFSGLGSAYYSLGQYDTAIDFHQQALTINREIGARQGEAQNLGNLGSVYYSLGQYDRAIDFHQQSLAIKREIGDRAGEAASLGNLGLAYSSLGQYDRAIDFDQQSLAIKREIGDRSGEAKSLGNLGSVYSSLGQYDRAIDFHQQALTINREIGARQGEAQNLGNLGLAYSSLGQYDRAIAFHQQFLAIAREIGDRLGEANSLHSLGIAYRNLENYDEALKYYDQALPIHREIGDRSGEGLILSNLGYLFQRQNQPELAISFYQQSVAVREAIRRDLRNLTTDLQQSYTDTVAGTYRRLADLLLAAGRVEEAQEVLELLKVEEFQDYAATRGFQVASAAPVARAVDPSPGAVGSPELFPLQATVDLIALGQELVECERQRPVCGNRDRLQAERDAANANFNRNLERLQAQIRRERADDPARLDPAELSRAAKAVVQGQPNTVLIYPVVLEDKLWLVWGAQSGDRGVVLQSQVVEVTQAQLGLAVQQFRQLLQQADPASVAGVQQLSQRLYGWLIEPIRAELEANGIEHLVFSLDRSTRYIPLAALFDGQRYLVQDFTISTILTAGLTDLSDTLAPSVNHNPVLAMGLSEAVAGQAPLPNVPAELAGIVGDSNRRGVFPGSSFLNRRFSLDTLEDNLINHRILHLATHGIFTSRRPGESYILLGTGEKLTIPEIKTLEDLAGVHLVTLSACETGLGGPDEDGLEVSGMSYFFLTSGAKSVLASLWQVSDASTSELMQGFYAVLAQGGVTKAEALRQAQLQVLATPGFEHPFFWAPFYLVGNNR